MWTEKRKELWEAVVARGGRRPNVVAHRESPLEKRVMKAIRMGDVRKALQLFTAAPFAPKNAETLEKLKALHPDARVPIEPPSEQISASPYFDEKVVREALATFSPCSAAGVFGYRPRLLQQCARAESFYFMPSLTRAVNYFCSGEAPDFLQPFIAGGVSIALAKPNRGATSVQRGCNSSLGRKVLLSRRKGRNF